MQGYSAHCKFIYLAYIAVTHRQEKDEKKKENLILLNFVFIVALKVYTQLCINLSPDPHWLHVPVTSGHCLLHKEVICN